MKVEESYDRTYVGMNSVIDLAQTVQERVSFFSMAWYSSTVIYSVTYNVYYLGALGS